MPSQIEEISSLPPTPYRASPWYDPAVNAPRPQAKPRIRRFRWTMVFLGGVVLPIASLILNEAFDVVRLGVAGVVIIAVTVLSMGLNLLLVPTKRVSKSAPVIITGPESVSVRFLLLFLSLFSALFWGYLAILFLPMLPLSAIGIIIMGVGLCGFCPYGALAISVVQSVRLWRLLRPQTSLWRRQLVMLVALGVPIILAASMGIYRYQQRSAMQQKIREIANASPFSRERMETIASLRGQEQALVAFYLASNTRDQKKAISEAYHRLTDSSIREVASHRWRSGFRRPIRPWFFLDGSDGVALNMWRI
jgi:hypothetical protein